MANNLYPSYVQVKYHSLYGNHTMSLPTLRWNADELGTPGTFDTHDGFGIAADTMVEALVDTFLALYPDTVIFDGYTIFNAPVLSVPIVFNPVYAASLALEGADATPMGVDKAVQYSIGYRTVTFGRSQIVLLDVPAGNTWGNVTTPDATTLAITAEWTAATNGWAGRDNGRPFTFTNISISMNKRLRRKYGMI
jgi:hypothetical protein